MVNEKANLLKLGSSGMMARRDFGRGLLGLMAGALAALALSGCGVLGGNSYHFRMTVEVDTPQGVKTGSSVYSVKAGKRIALMSEEAERYMEIRGEAAVVDLPGGPVFILLKTPKDGQDVAFGKMSMRALDPVYEDDWVESAGRISGSWSALKGELPREDWPMMVRFSDLSDPTSVEQVDPASIGVKRILIETTSDDVTTGIGKRLGWLDRIKGGYLHGGFTSRGTPLGLDGTAFSTEIGK